jgi:long-subunit acyl-CoA synthetase (AMP-forming)
MKIIKQEIQVYAKSNDLRKVEIPMQIQILEEGLTIENGFLTPTMKLQRYVAEKRFRQEMEKLYELPKIEYEQ